MSAAPGSRPPKYSGRYRYQKIDMETGEVIEQGEYDEITADAPPTPPGSRRAGGNFAILYLIEFYNLLAELGTKKMAVVKYILEHIGYDNMLIKTAKEIAAGSSASEITVKRTLKKLEEANLITRKPGIIMLNPKLLNRKNVAGERNIMVKYNDIKQDKEQRKNKTTAKTEE